MATSKITTPLPSMMNYMRSINPSLGLMYAVNGDQRIPIEVRETTVRGTIGDYKDGHVEKPKKAKEDGDESKSSAVENPNIQRIDTAFLPPGFGTLAIDYSLTFLAHSLSPDACNDNDYRDLLTQFTSTYRQNGGYQVLASLYLWNIANGRALFRNRFGKNRSVTVTVKGDPGSDNDEKQVFHFADDPSLTLSDFSAWQPGDDAQRLVALIAAALSGRSGPLFLAVSTCIDLNDGAEVYPSQEFIQGQGQAKKQVGSKGKTLASTPHGNVSAQAILHSQKLGNAIRTIDIWHAESDRYGPIPVEPYGVVQKRFAVVRPAHSRTDLFSYLEALDRLIERLGDGNEATPIPDDAHYVMACLIRGGVFSGESKKTRDTKPAKAAK